LHNYKFNIFQFITINNYFRFITIFQHYSYFWTAKHKEIVKLKGKAWNNQHCLVTSCLRTEIEIELFDIYSKPSNRVSSSTQIDISRLLIVSLRRSVKLASCVNLRKACVNFINIFCMYVKCPSFLFGKKMLIKLWWNWPWGCVLKPTSPF